MKIKNVTSLVIALVGIYFFTPDIPMDQAQPKLQVPDEQDLRQLALTYTLADPKLEPGSKALAQWGRKLFFESSFSKSKSISCSTCHIPALSFTDGRKLGHGLAATSRNTPTIINSSKMDWFFWDGRAHSLEHQALGPIENAKEHGFSRTAVAQVIISKHLAPYETLFGEIHHRDAIAALDWRPPPKAEIEPLPIELAAYGIGTLSNADLQVALISQAARRGVSPQRLFASLAMGELGDEPYKDIPMGEELAHEIDEIFYNVSRAIAAYERRIVANQSPFDKFLRRLEEGEQKPVASSFDAQFGDLQWEGFKVFVGAGCVNCHHSGIFSDQQFHNIGLSQDSLDIGRAKGAALVQSSRDSCKNLRVKTEACAEIPYLKPGAYETMGAFKTPTLRNVAITAPYMHDGRFASLDEVLDHYENIKEKEPGIGHISESLRNFDLDDQERKHLKMFLESLSSPIRELW